MSRQEKLVIIFLLVILVAGLGVHFYKRANYPKIKAIPTGIKKEFNYVKYDGFIRQLVNINTANKNELTLLSGIGPSLADNIITYRRENGFFVLPEDIIKVSGIGKSKYEHMKEFITTEND